ncbi:MAG: Ku protein [Candidatus Pacearchaeota archaeon]
MKAVWRGSIAFGLVNIPVKLYNAIEPKQFSFRLLCGKCKTPLKYMRFCPKCKKEVAWQDVVHGFEIRKGEWKVFTKEQLTKLKPPKSEQIELIGFTSADHFDPILFSSNYFIVPEGKQKAYFLFRELLQNLAKVALARIILHNKEYMAIIRAYKKGMLLTTLHYLYELRDINELKELEEKIAISKQEFELGKKLVAELLIEPELSAYKDRYEEKLRELILGKVGKEKEKELPKPEKLLEALKLSIKKRQEK